MHACCVFLINDDDDRSSQHGCGPIAASMWDVAASMWAVAASMVDVTGAM